MRSKFASRFFRGVRASAFFLGSLTMAQTPGFAAEPFHVQAHRGASAEAMENTLEAFERAFRMGATSIELDVHLTRDGHLVIYHDFHLDPGCCRLKDGTPFPEKQMVIRDMTLDEVRQVILNPDSSKRLVKHRPFLKNEEYRIPTLAEVYDLAEKIGPVKGKETLIDVEVKSLADHPEWSPPPDVFARAVADEIAAKNGKHRSLVRSFDFRILEEMRKVDPEMRIAMLTEKGVDFLTPAARLRPAIVAPNVADLNREVVAKIHEMGMQVIPWTVNGPENWAHMQEIGVDGVTTDDPLGLIRFLNSQERTSQLELRAADRCLADFRSLKR